MTDLYNFLDRFNIPNPFDNIVMEGIGFPDVYDRYATAEVKVECYGDGKVNFSAKIGDPSFPEALVSDKRLKRFLDAKTKFCGEFQQNADGSGVYVNVDADFASAAIEAVREQARKLQYMIATHDDLDSLKYASRHMLATCETLEKLEILEEEYS